MEKQKVCLNRCEDYNFEEIKRILKVQIDALGGTDMLLSKGKNVAVKPNIVMRKDASAAATTHPAVIRAVCEIFKEAGANVTVAESSGGLYNPAVMALNYKGCGIAKAAEDAGVVLHSDYSETQLYRDENIKCRSFSVISPLAKADVIVNVSKLKTHTIATMSGAVKNMFGAIPGVQKVEMHSRFPKIDDFCDMLIDLSLTLPPTLCVCDAIDAMEGNGPTAGKKTHVGALLSSLSPYALDIASARLAKIPLDKVPLITAAEKRGILPALNESIELCGDSIDALSKKLALPDTTETRFETLSTMFGGRITKWLTARPVIDKKVCKGCGECVRNCPQKLIEIKNGKAKINRNGCIHCFCCHELCRYHAVSIKKPFISRI